MQNTVCSGLSLCKSSGNITQNLIKLLSLSGRKIWGGKMERGRTFVKLLCYMVLTLELYKCFIYKFEFKKNKNKYL